VTTALPRGKDAWRPDFGRIASDLRRAVVPRDLSEGAEQAVVFKRRLGLSASVIPGGMRSQVE